MGTTARSTKWLRDNGWAYGIVEKTDPYTGLTHDYLGIIDIIAVYGTLTLGIQACSKGDKAAHVWKILEEPRLLEWLDGETRTFEVQAWEMGPMPGSGSRRKVWFPRRYAFLLGDDWEGVKIVELDQEGKVIES